MHITLRDDQMYPVVDHMQINDKGLTMMCISIHVVLFCLKMQDG